MDANEHSPFPYSREDTAEQPASGAVAAPELPEIPPPPPAWTPEPSSALTPEASSAWSPAPQPEAPRSAADGAWSFGKPASGPALPKGRRSLAVALVMVLVAAAGAYTLLSRSPSSGGTAFALALTRDQTYTYDVRVGMDGGMSNQGQQLPFKMVLDQTISWRVESTDSDGTATVAVTVRARSGQVNGQPAPSLPTQTTRIRVAKDGRILSSDFGMAGLGGSTSDLGSLVPGSDQFMPLLPDHPVKVGDSWTKKFDQDLPFGMGRLRYAVDSTLLRYEMVNGKQTAVLFSTMSLPLDMSIDLRKVLEGAGNGAGQLPLGGGNPKMKFDGSMTIQQTAWFDQARGELARSSANANFDMSLSFSDFPQQAGAPSGPISFKGTMTVQVERVEKVLPLSRKAKDAGAQADLRNALVAAKTFFTESGSYRGFTPAAAGKLDSSMAFNRAGKARVGQISIRVAGKGALLLVTRSATGNVFCVAERQGKVSYGRRDAKTVTRCRGGW